MTNVFLTVKKKQIICPNTPIPPPPFEIAVFIQNFDCLGEIQASRICNIVSCWIGNSIQSRYHQTNSRYSVRLVLVAASLKFLNTMKQSTPPLFQVSDVKTDSEGFHFSFFFLFLYLFMFFFFKVIFLSWMWWKPLCIFSLIQRQKWLCTTPLPWLPMCFRFFPWLTLWSE
jgi:hypothetical protein